MSGALADMICAAILGVAVGLLLPMLAERRGGGR